MPKRCCLEAPMSNQRKVKTDSLGELIFYFTRRELENPWPFFLAWKLPREGELARQRVGWSFDVFRSSRYCHRVALAPPKTWRVVIFPVAPFVSPESSTSGRIRRPICISLNFQNQNFFVWFLSVWSWRSWRLLLSSYFRRCIKRINLCTSFFIIKLML